MLLMIPFSEICILQVHFRLSEGPHCSACLKLQQIQSKIRECKELLETLYTQEIHIKSSINALHDPITRRLPRELVSEIFVLSSLHSVGTESFFNSASTGYLRYQFSLGSVSKIWRNIVRSTPQLWTTIRISLRVNALPQMELLRLHLKLSGSLPLHIQARTGYTPSTLDYSKLAPILETLNVSSYRWKTLDLDIPPQLLSHVNGGSSGAPMLECLRVYCSHEQMEPTAACFQVPYGPPSPRVVDTYGIAFPSIRITWKNVTEATICVLKYHECLALFKHAPELVSLTTKVLIAANPDPKLCEVVTALRLASLDVEISGDASLFFEKLTLPSLVTLNVDGKGPFDSLEHLFRRSMCPLRSLSFFGPDFGRVDIIAMFRATLLLEELVFSSAIFRGLGEFFKTLANTKLLNDVAPDSHSIFLPRLATLQFFGSIEVPWHMVSSLFPPDQRPPHARYRPLRGLECFLYIDEDENYYLEKDVVLQILDIRRQGHIITIRDEENDADLVQVSYDHHVGSISAHATSLQRSCTST